MSRETTVEDKIFIENLTLPCTIGVLDTERITKQEVVVDVVVSLSLRRAGITDDIRRTVSYSELRGQVTEFVSTGDFRLLEGVAEGVASLVLKKRAARKVMVRVRKKKYSEAPLMGVEITRLRHG